MNFFDFKLLLIILIMIIVYYLYKEVIHLKKNLKFLIHHNNIDNNHTEQLHADNIYEKKLLIKYQFTNYNK